jgi:hypothetical protein
MIASVMAVADTASASGKWSRFRPQSASPFAPGNAAGTGDGLERRNSVEPFP